MSDLRYALRQLFKSPGFTAIAVLTLALGIGANTAIYSVINSALIRPLPYTDSSRLVEIWSHDGKSPFPWTTGPRLKQWREHAGSFDGIAAIHDRFAFNLIDAGRADRVAGAQVSANYLDVLRLPALLGRGFAPGDDQVGFENRVVILAYDWWQSRFGGDRTIIGRTVNFNRQSYTVIGVLPPRALPNDGLNFLVPLVLEGAPWQMDSLNPWVRVTARLKPGVTSAQAKAELIALAAELEARILPDRQSWGTEVRPMQQVLVETSRPTFLLLLGAVGLVLLIACANVANLLLVRAAGRHKEMAVRLALGASTGQIVRQVLTESVVLALLGGAVGVGLAAWGTELLQRLTASVLPSLMRPEIDLRVLLFSFFLAVGTGVIFGLVPALQARQVDVNANLKESGKGLTSGNRSRAQSLLIISEVALTVVLLVGAGLLLRSFARVLGADAGYDTRQTLVCDVSLTLDQSDKPDALLQHHRALAQRIRELPGVTSVGTTTTLPLDGNLWGALVGRAEQPVDEHTQGAFLDYVGADFFAAMGMRLLQGRLFTDADNQLNAPRLAIINQELAVRLFADASPLGRRIHFKEADWEVTGVVNGVRQAQVDAAAQEHIYAVHAFSLETICLVVRTTVAPLSLVEPIRRVGAALDPDQSIGNFRTLEQAVDNSLQERRVTLGLLAVFAIVALALACLGIYGVMTYTIQQRQRELSIRMALGADRRDIVRQVLRDGVGLGLVGIGIGLAGAIVGGKLIASRLYEVGSLDPIVFIAVPVVVTFVTIAATYFPARRTTRFNPIDALHAE